MSSQVEVTSLDENSMKRMVLSIEKRINENMQMRTKYGDKPERFMDSERRARAAAPRSCYLSLH